jgi:FAD/FMN-containing dehydrogenase/Fe-S oxidoreductase
MKEHLQNLSDRLEGDLHWDNLHKTIYATDASVYRIIPLAVAFPKNENDIVLLCAFAKANSISLIPRAAGTSLAGQVVGKGIVVDCSKYMNEVLAIDSSIIPEWVKTQPGVVRDELNRYLEEYRVYFGPNTSTSNRATLGGMVGNNSSGTTSISEGTTRDWIQELRMVLWDGSVVVFGDLEPEELQQKMALQTAEGAIYRGLIQMLEPSEVQKEIKDNFPKHSGFRSKNVQRRNTGYALDELLEMEPFYKGTSFNLCPLIVGSEGTLGFITEITTYVEELDIKQPTSMVAIHFESIQECMEAVVPIMNHYPVTCEMMDKIILDCTKSNRSQVVNRFFVEGDPKAILLVELKGWDEETQYPNALKLIAELKEKNLGYAYPILVKEQIKQALELRKAGLGLLGNIVGDKKAVACIEDTAVAIEDLASYIGEFSKIMERYEQQAVYYAHAGAGELHLRPILNLKKRKDVKLFREITQEVVKLVKKYNGSLSGEHGDGIVRSEFIIQMVGEKNYALFKKVKTLFDPHNIFNPGKIIDPLPMDQNLRYVVGRKEPEINTLLDFSSDQGILRSAEKCNGSGDCRKLPAAGGTMCPSYRATRDEKDTTRARANALREILTTSDRSNRFDHKELKDVFDLCISCKACASECPSNVDVATLKAEFEYQYKKENGSTLRTKLFAYNTRINRAGAKFPKLYNGLLGLTSGITKSTLGIAAERSLPKLDVFVEKEQRSTTTKTQEAKVILYVDEFSQYLDGSIAQDAYELLGSLGYDVYVTKNINSGRALISKGFLAKAKDNADLNIKQLLHNTTRETKIVGIEPSAILSFRDEYLKLADDKEAAQLLANRSFLIEEFLHQEINAGNITADHFTKETRKIKIHGHCHQKALSSIAPTFAILNLPENYTPTIIPSGCCGMAGSFGYEKEHYDISMQIGEQTLFPAVRRAGEDVLIAANGTSCRHQIKDGTNRLALHPVTILRQALKN